MILNGNYVLCFKIHTSFGAHQENLNEDRPISDEDVAQFLQSYASPVLAIVGMFVCVSAVCTSFCHTLH